MIGVGLGLTNYRQGGDALTAAVKALFAGGKKGGMWDWRTSVALSGSLITTAIDLSGNGNDITYSGTARPAYDATLGALHDGLDDGGATPSLSLSGLTKATIIIAERKTSDVTNSVLIGVPSSVSTQLGDPRSSSVVRGYAAAGSVEARTSIYAAPATSVLTAIYDAGGATDADKIKIRRNGASDTALNGTGATVSFSNGALTFGKNTAGTLFFTGYEIRAFVIFDGLDAASLKLAETWVAEPTGITIP